MNKDVIDHGTAGTASPAGQQADDLVLRITSAYESGFGHAARHELKNPFVPKSPEAEAWAIGREIGLERAGQDTQQRVCSKCEATAPMFLRDGCEATGCPQRASVESASGWTRMEDGVPPLGVECLLQVKSAIERDPYYKLDTWNTQREAPVGWSSATIETGDCWDDTEVEDVIAWMVRPSFDAQPQKSAERETAQEGVPAEVKAVIDAAQQWWCEREPQNWDDAELAKAVIRLNGDWPGCPECDFECGEPCVPATVDEQIRAVDCAIAQLVHEGKLHAPEGYSPPDGWTPQPARKGKTCLACLATALRTHPTPSQEGVESAAPQQPKALGDAASGPGSLSLRCGNASCRSKREPDNGQNTA